MTMLHTANQLHARPANGNASRLLARFGRFLDRLVAAMIANAARRAERAALGRLGDRELKDIGVYRCQIEHGRADAARERLREQQSARQ